MNIQTTEIMRSDEWKMNVQQNDKGWKSLGNVVSNFELCVEGTSEDVQVLNYTNIILELHNRQCSPLKWNDVNWFDIISKCVSHIAYRICCILNFIIFPFSLCFYRWTDFGRFKWPTPLVLALKEEKKREKVSWTLR